MSESLNADLRGFAGKMKMLENLAAEADERFAGAIAWALQVNLDFAIDATGRRRHDKDAITHVDGFINVVSNEKHCSAAIFPEPQHFVLQAHTGEGIERAERFVEEENFRVIDECACQSNALGHAPGEMMRICAGKCLESDEPHEVVYFISFFAQYSACDETSFNVVSNSQPRKQVWILKNKTAFRARLIDWIRAN